MGNLKRRRQSTRAQALQRSHSTTRLPLSLRKELGAIEDHNNGYDYEGSLNGSDSDASSPQPQQRQLSRKERRKQLRIQQQQKKQEHQRLRKRRRTENVFGAVTPLQQQQRNKQQKDGLPSGRPPVNEKEAHFSEGEVEGSGKSDSEDEAYGVPEDGVSIGAAAVALKQHQQLHQQRVDDRLQEELRLLENRLGIRRSRKKGTEASAGDKMKKLREELKEDGFDFELQDVLDDILGTGEARTEVRSSEAEGTDVDETFSDASTVREEDAFDSGEGPADSEELDTDSKPDEALGVLVESAGAARDAEPSKMYVAPHRRRQETDTADLIISKASLLEAIKVEVVRALNRVAEGNTEPVLHQLLRVLERNAADLRRERVSGKQMRENLRAYTVGVRQLLCEQLMQSCIKSRFSTNSLIATQTALCCALGKMWDMELCRDFLGSLAVCFSTYFSRALVQRKQEPQGIMADMASLTARHAAVGVCCLYDFGFVSPRLFLELILRVAGVREDDCQKTTHHKSDLSDFRVEMLLLLLRLGGSKLRHDDAKLFTNTWNSLQGLVQRQRGDVQPRAAEGSLSGGEGSIADTGRLRALLLELQDLKSGKQKDRLLLVKASQDAMRRWLSSSAVFGPTLLSSQFQINGSWAALEKGEKPYLSAAAASAVQFQQHQHLNTGGTAAAPDAAVVAAAAHGLQHKASLLRFNTELQQKLFECLMMANGPDDALRILQNSGHLTLKKNTVTQIVAVAMQCCLQEKTYNQFYGLVLSRLCGICVCGAASVGNDGACNCFLLPEKAGVRYLRTVQRGLAAQVSAAHGFSLRRLLNLAKLTAFLIRLGVADLRIVRFLCFDSAVGEQGPMGLSGKLGVFLREVCVELLCNPIASASPFLVLDNWEESAVGYFKCIRSMSDICEAFIALLQDVVLPGTKARSHTADPASTANRSGSDGALKASVVKLAIKALLDHRQPDEKGA